MGYKGRYSHIETRTVLASTSITVVTPKVLRNETVTVTFASVMDYTTANKVMIIGIRDATGRDIYLQQDEGLATYRSQHGITLQGRLTLIEGESMVLIVESPTSADVLYFSVFGDRYEIKPSQ